MVRRSPGPAERKRDPERTRERILDAALAEFGEHGFAGARISAIAARAGVNQQLISYYFDGKAGLYQALSQRWRQTSAGLNQPSAPLADVVDNFVRASVEFRHGTRMLVWEGLTGPADPSSADDFFPGLVEDIRRRQAGGELAADLDPAYLLLLLFAAAAAPVLLPHVAERMTGLPADSAEFLDGYRAQLRGVVERLAR